MARTTRRARAVRMRPEDALARADTLAGEEPLEILLDGERWLVTMRTPGHDVDLVHGLLLAEGVVTRPDQVRQISYGAGVEADGLLSYNVVEVTLDRLAGAVPPAPETRRAVYVSASCGICGSPSMAAVAHSSAFPVAGVELQVPLATLLALPDLLRARQPLFDKTGGTHAAGLFVGDEAVCVREDVGRHNAVDKVLGWALREGRVPVHDAVLQLSGRVSYELVQKAASAGVPVVAAVSAPSAAAVELAEDAGITLAAFSRGSSLSVYTRPDRVVT